ncbi:hypothetical protein PAHAL_2G075400 [Panicum hallii]|uniref:Uncharacterized protein n=1 Tax=Panicum hallii TaxID=206008 RepID=A0A2S3GWY8_9POAL|nr:hypothetical protein PAHAL_2G075400 [Panicum hallii]
MGYRGRERKKVEVERAEERRKGLAGASRLDLAAGGDQGWREWVILISKEPSSASLLPTVPLCCAWSR